MIKLLFFDLGDTLIHNGQPFPYVHDSLSVISHFLTKTNEPVVLGLISDFGMVSNSAAELSATEAEFKQILIDAKLDHVFEPFDSRVTISARAGVRKPDKRIFELAIGRSGLTANFAECLFVTENKSHLLSAREQGMAILGFRVTGADFPVFSEWQDAPLLIANLIAPNQAHNQEEAVAHSLKVTHRIERFKCLSRKANTLFGQGTRMYRLHDRELGSLDGVFIPMAVDVVVDCSKQGVIDRVREQEIAKEDIDDAIHEIQRLVRQGKLATESESLPSGATHRIEIDAEGRRTIARSRYSKQ